MDGLYIGMFVYMPFRFRVKDTEVALTMGAAILQYLQ